MKFLIWTVTILVLCFLNELLGAASGIKVGRVLIWVVIWFVASRLCKAWDKRNGNSKKEVSYEKATKLCPHCGKYVSWNSTVCEHCGHEMKSHSAAPDEHWESRSDNDETVPSEPDGKPCPSCGQHNPYGFGVCGQCGFVLNPSAVKNSEPCSEPAGKEAAEQPEGAFCSKCGFKLFEGSKFCSRCGTETK